MDVTELSSDWVSVCQHLFYIASIRQQLFRRLKSDTCLQKMKYQEKNYKAFCLHR